MVTQAQRGGEKLDPAQPLCTRPWGFPGEAQGWAEASYWRGHPVASSEAVWPEILLPNHIACGMSSHSGTPALQSAHRETHPTLYPKMPPASAPRSSSPAPVSRLPWVLLARPMERLRWLRVRKWEKEEVESMVPLRPPRAFVGHRNWVYDTVWKEDKGQVRGIPRQREAAPDPATRSTPPTGTLTAGTWRMTSIPATSVPEPLPVADPDPPHSGDTADVCLVTMCCCPRCWGMACAVRGTTSHKPAPAAVQAPTARVPDEGRGPCALRGPSLGLTSICPSLHPAPQSWVDTQPSGKKAAHITFSPPAWGPRLRPWGRSAGGPVHTNCWDSSQGHPAWSLPTGFGGLMRDWTHPSHPGCHLQPGELRMEKARQPWCLGSLLEAEGLSASEPQGADTHLVMGRRLVGTNHYCCSCYPHPCTPEHACGHVCVRAGRETSRCL